MEEGEAPYLSSGKKWLKIYQKLKTSRFHLINKLHAVIISEKIRKRAF